MSSRVCPGCGRRVPRDIGACLACGSDIGDDVVVSTVTTGAMPPPPPTVVIPVWSPPMAVAAASGPGGVLRPSLSPGTAAVRWLAVAGHIVVAGFFTFTAVLTIVGALVRARSSATTDEFQAAYMTGQLAGSVVGVLFALWVISRAHRLLGTHDARRFRGALPGDALVVLMPLTAFVLTGNLVTLLATATTIGVAAASGLAAVLLARPVTAGG